MSESDLKRITEMMSKKVGEILIPTLVNKKIPLKEITSIRYITGPAFIYREGSSRYIAVGFSIEGRDFT
ncbi:MAG: hypothetical protein KIT33_04720 [Candidatus Kapabacteria bacterium]|nr:hypothetical protein [Ignavibacteriota bacterium]MCW5884261.1 hypothetical protein [Candidatus Kapabacteria bacterium]